MTADPNQKNDLEFSILYQITVELAEQHELSAIYRLMVDRSMSLLRASSAAIFLYDLRQKDLEVVWSRGKAVRPSLRIHMGEGIVGSAAMTGQIMVVNDFAAQEKKFSQSTQIPAFAMVAAPMFYCGDLIGILAVFEEVDPLHSFRETDGRLLMLVAGQLASAVHNSRLFEESSERAAHLTLLYDAGLALNSALKSRGQLEFLLKIAMEALHADRAAFYRYNDGQEEFRFELGLGYNERVLDEFQRTKIAASDDYCLVGWVGKNRLPINVPDADKDPRYIVVDPYVRSMLLASVEHEGHLLGVLAMSGVRINSFNPQAERSLNLYANLVAVAIENGRLFDEAQTSLRRSQFQRPIDYAIAANSDLISGLNLMLDQYLIQLGADAADILLINADSQTLNYAVGRGFIKAAIQMTKIKIGEGLAGKAAYDRCILMAPDLEQYPDWYAHAPMLASEGFHSYYALPFASHGSVKGVLEIYNRKIFTPDREWLAFLGSLERQITVAIDNFNLIEGLRSTNVGLQDAFDRTLDGWLRALTMHTGESQDHSRRLVEKTLLMAKASGASNESLIHVYRGALLHDVGMLGVPTAILNKPGSLNEEEWGIVRKHPVFAYELIYPIALLRPAMEIPYGHHEKWDGSGYPRGLAGALIPEAARWFSVVDVFESFTTSRVYRLEPWSEEKACQYLLDQSGKAFDPEAVEIFLNLIKG